MLEVNLISVIRHGHGDRAGLGRLIMGLVFASASAAVFLLGQAQPGRKRPDSYLPDAIPTHTQPAYSAHSHLLAC